MKTRLRHLALLAGLTLGSVNAQAQAEYNWIGFGSLAWSQQGIDSLNIGGFEVTPINNATFDPAYAPEGYSELEVSVVGTQSQWLPGGQLLSWQSHGGFRIDAQAVSGVSGGGDLSITDLDVNFATGQVSANVQSTRSGANTREVIWTFDTSLVQVDNDDSPQLWAGNTYYHDVSIAIPVLSLTSTGQDLLKSGLGLTFLGGVALQAVAQDYASLTLSGSVPGPENLTVAVVPEPGTWALMGLGLVGLAGLNRARSRQSCAESA